jgi:CheY-like chemotaxis protein
VRLLCERTFGYPRYSASLCRISIERDHHRSIKSHLEVEEEPSTITHALQVLCELIRMLGTYVRTVGVVDHTAPRSRLCDDDAVTSVLIVDDHPSFRASARAILEEEGFEVVGEVDDGESAIAAASRLEPDVVLLDVQLPDATGFEVCERLCRSERRPSIVLVSTRDASDYDDLIRQSLARGFISKAELSGEAVRELLA